ncbi:hypothetical protein GCM10023317_11360 [Actinopolymorpha pittospori]
MAGRGWFGVGALGALSFGLVHFYWAVGGRLGLPAEVGPISDRTWFLVYDLVAGLAFVGFAGGAGVLAAGRGSGRLQVWLVRDAAWGGVLALVRGGLGLVQDVFLIDEIGVGALYDVVFTAGGLIFVWSAYLLWSARRP